MQENKQWFCVVRHVYRQACFQMHKYSSWLVLSLKTTYNIVAMHMDLYQINLPLAIHTHNLNAEYILILKSCQLGDYAEPIYLFIKVSISFSPIRSC